MGKAPPRAGIGTENESSLHRALKLRYAAQGETEAARAGYVCDAVAPDGEILEIQTGSFAPLRTKLPALTTLGPVRLIHPVIVQKTIELCDIRGKVLYRRKSPRRGSAWDLFTVLLYAPELALLPGLTIEIALVDALEHRIDDGKGSWRRKGISIADRTLESWRDSIKLRSPADYGRFLPFSEKEEFTAAILAKKVKIRPVLARKTLYVLTKTGMVKRIRKAGKSWVYTV
jgi:hypothetical protein